VAGGGEADVKTAPLQAAAVMSSPFCSSLIMDAHLFLTGRIRDESSPAAQGYGGADGDIAKVSSVLVYLQSFNPMRCDVKVMLCIVMVIISGSQNGRSTSVGSNTCNLYLKYKI